MKSESVSSSVMSDFLRPMECSPSDSSVHGILQARILEWVTIPFSRRSSQPRDRTPISRIAVRFFTVWATRKELKTCSKAWWGFPGCANVKNLPANAGEVGVADLFPFPRYSLGKICWRRAWQPTLVFLPGESPRTEEPGGLKSIGSQRVKHNWSDLAHKHQSLLPCQRYLV